MNYYICEGEKTGKYNASSKAREDIEKILINNKYQAKFINTKYGVRTKKILKIFQFKDYLMNYFIWNKFVKSLNKDDKIIIQYPLINTTLFFEKIIEKIDKKCNVIILIHDLDSLRYKPEIQGEKLYQRVKHEDTTILNKATKVICHNYKMKEELIKFGVSENKIFELKIFDYLYDGNEMKNKRFEKSVIIAGRIAPDKAKYLKYLKEIKNVKFNLYGAGLDESILSDNVEFKGCFLPEELLSKLQGGFGLIWDGDETDSCHGGFGEYLKYNNPHKTSMYLAANIPIIIWKEAALAKFVEENNIGFTISSLNEIPSKLSSITNEEYCKILNNIEPISKKIRNGLMFENILKEI